MPLPTETEAQTLPTDWRNSPTQVTSVQEFRTLLDFSENVFPIAHFLLITSTSSLQFAFKINLLEQKTLRKP